MRNISKPNPVLRVLALLQKEKKEVILLLSLVVVSTAADLSVPFVSQRLIDALIEFLKNSGEAPVKFLITAGAVILAATVLSKLFKSVYDYRLFMVSTGLEDIVHKNAFQKYLRLHILFHHGSSSGQIIGRIERGTVAIYTILHDIFGQNLLPPLVIFLGVLVLLFTKSPWIGLAVFLPLPLYLLVIGRITDKIYKIERQAHDQFELIAKESYDVAGNVLTVKKFSQEEAETEHYAALQKEARVTQYQGEKLWSVIETTQTFIATFCRVCVILLAGFFVVKGKSTIGEFVLYVTLQNMAYNPLTQLSHIFPRLRRNMARAERLFGVLDEPILVADKLGADILPPHEKSIEFRNVWFRYGKGKRLVLKNISVSIPQGTAVALVGQSGSGKTTFINLLLRSFDPEKGGIFIDGRNLRDITRKSLLDQIAVVPQEVDLFSRSIFENIAYGKSETAKEEVIKAAQTALAHDFILAADDGYDTVVGERGIKLSGGERQRIGIARAILRDPKILILDEATSHLDTESERLIAEATRALIKNRTTFIIAHRLSTILEADMILVFKGGEIESAGTHAELLRASPTYQKLYSLQFNIPKKVRL